MRIPEQIVKVCRFVFVVLLCGGWQASAAVVPWVPPIGIPSPDFGIHETHYMYKLGNGETCQSHPHKCFNFGRGLEPYRDNGNGPYTHYVNISHAECVAYRDGVFGSPAAPLCDLSRQFTAPAGSVIELHGGPYLYNSWRRLYSAGTPSRPVFFRGADAQAPVRIRGNTKKHDFRLGGSYLIVENLEYFQNAHLKIKENVPNHIAIRNVEIHNPPGFRINTGAAIELVGTDIVIYNNHIHHNQNTDESGQRLKDLHGIHPKEGSERIWIVDNHIHHNSGDSVQSCHFCTGAKPRYIYIGRNHMHEDRENAVDLKSIRDVIVSQNTMYGYQDSSTSSGDALVIGSNGINEKGNNGPENVWVVFNRISDSKTGIRVEGAFAPAHILGNTISNVTTGIILEKRAKQLHIVNNTIHGGAYGIQSPWRCDFEIFLVNNIISNMTDHHIDIKSCIANASDMQHNLLWQNGDAVSVRWGTTVSTSNSAKINQLVKSRNNLIGNPRFENAAASNFALTSGSAAIANGIRPSGHDTFLNRYGLRLDRDSDGTQSDNPKIDIGAHKSLSPVRSRLVQPRHLRILNR